MVKLTKELQELVEGDRAATIGVQHSAALEQVLLDQVGVQSDQLGHEVSDLDLLGVRVGDVDEDVLDILALIPLNLVKDLLQLLDALTHGLGHLIV